VQNGYENVLPEQQLCDGLAGRRRMLLLSLQKCHL
jgi:hypothetical protein